MTPEQRAARVVVDMEKAESPRDEALARIAHEIREAVLEDRKLGYSSTLRRTVESLKQQRLAYLERGSLYDSEAKRAGDRAALLESECLVGEGVRLSWATRLALRVFG